MLFAGAIDNAVGASATVSINGAGTDVVKALLL
jgi:hypothetical protein